MKDDLNMRTFQVENGTVQRWERVDGGSITTDAGVTISDLPPFYRLCVNLKPKPECNLNVEIWLPLPEDWNGRFLGTGNGGGAGSIVYDMIPIGLRRGFASANTDLGTSPDVNDMVDFPERQNDFGNRGTHAMAVAAKNVIEQFYGRAPKASYYIGGSTGGQQGLLEAQRYPADFNGIIAGAPANNRTHIHTMFLWNLRAMRTQDGSLMFTQEELNRITQTVIDHYMLPCGGAPGDRFLTDPRLAKVDTSIFEGLDFSEKQMAALEKVYQGPVNPRTGKRIYGPILPGSECHPLGLFWQQNPAQLIPEQFYPFKWTFGKDFDYTKFDFDADMDAVDDKLARVMNANDPDLSAFRALGGKMIMYAGTTDPGVPFHDAMYYYERVTCEDGGLEETQKYFRFFLIPGLTHIVGGPGLNDFGQVPSQEVPLDAEHNMLTALMSWCEEGRVPDKIIATAYEDVENCRRIRFQRPIYPYPLFPKYKGGDPRSAGSFAPEAHVRGWDIHCDDAYLR